MRRRGACVRLSREHAFASWAGALQRPDPDCGAVGADLRPGRAELRRVEAKRDHGVRALGGRLLLEALLGVYSALREHLRHALQLAADHRLQRRAELRADVARADGESEDLA